MFYKLKIIRKMKKCIQNEPLFDGCSFSFLKYEYDWKCRTDALGGYLLKTLGGDCEGYVIISFGAQTLSMKLCFSDARGRVVSDRLRENISTLSKDRFGGIDYKAFYPGKCSASFSLWLKNVTEDNFEYSFNFLVASVKRVLGQL